MKNRITLWMAFCLMAVSFLQAQPLETVAILPGGQPIGTAFKGSDLYVSAYLGNKIVKIDLTQPFPVTPTTVIDNIVKPTGLLVIGDYLYFNTEGNIPGLGTARSARINLTSPSPTIEQVMTNVIDDAQAYAKVGDTLYISSANNGIFRVILSQPFPQAGVQISSQNASGLALQGNELYCGHFNGDKVFKINRHQPNASPVTVVTGLAGPDGLTFSGNFLYVSESTGSRIVKFDVTQPSPLVETVVSGLVGPTLTAFDGLDIYFGQQGNGKISRLSINALSFSPPAQVCSNNPAALRTGGSPLGGIYSGPYVTDSGNGETFSFDGQAAGPGAYTVTYTLPNVSPATATVTVTAAPVIGVFGFSTDVVFPPTLLPDPAAGPAGGVYSGTGVLPGNIFDPALAGVGVHLLTYTFTDANGCTATGTGTISVTPAPHDGCSDAKDINNLFGAAYNVPQTSALQNNTGYTSTGDPAVTSGCFFQDDALQRTVWYTFTGDGNTYRIRSVQCNATNYIPDGDTQVALFTGNCSSPTQVDCNDDENVNANILNFNLVVATQPGEVYRMVVDGYGGAQGEYCLEVTNLTPSAIAEIGSIGVRVFPNPTAGLVQLTDVHADQVLVFDNMGRLILQLENPGNRIDLSNAPAGIYFLKITEGNTVYSARVVKQ
ncbi:MAG: T9SS type A sorting domain-containing protein [Saprospiraceae bacterium]|nr:T9SS type A sorting domain-containing protein [Saprospiraceae bacterium]